MSSNETPYFRELRTGQASRYAFRALYFVKDENGRSVLKPGVQDQLVSAGVVHVEVANWGSHQKLHLKVRNLLSDDQLKDLCNKTGLALEHVSQQKQSSFDVEMDTKYKREFLLWHEY